MLGLARIHLNDVPFHIVQRGHNCEPCSSAEEDYHSYLHWLGEALAKEGRALHAYALMTNLSTCCSRSNTPA